VQYCKCVESNRSITNIDISELLYAVIVNLALDIYYVMEVVFHMLNYMV
jgi:hypothetical protein